MTHIFLPLSSTGMGNKILPGLYNYVRCVQRVCVCVCVLTDKASIHSSVKVIGECKENIAVFELIRLMNNPLHHLKYFLITKLVSCITWRGNRDSSVNYASYVGATL